VSFYKPGCCVDGSCTPEDCMRLPYGVRCEHCAHIARCVQIFGKTPTSDTCDWWPRKWLSRQLERKARS